MRKQSLFIRISLVLTLLLLVAAVMVGCGEKDVADAQECTFTFTAVFADGSTEKHEIKTTCATVGEALLAEGLIAGEESATGIYVKTVCGVTADYDIDQTWWGLYVDGEQSMVGADFVNCADVTEVEFRVEK
ncbi:MAG: DUF4430 domain-containing protein [Clostridia bacterium]|nr:DUF4430 domain-containing protein [Clostridia bacterium]